jgi:hypothetical protein
MRNILIATGVASVLVGSALVSSPAQASWAENAQSDYPVYTGTAQSHWRAERSRRQFSHRAGRAWHPGYDAYGYSRGYYPYQRGYYPYGGGYYR